MAEQLRDASLQDEFRTGLMMIGVQGAYSRGDLAEAERAARRAIETFGSMDSPDLRGRLTSAYVFLGEIFVDRGQPAQAADAFRSAAKLAEECEAPIAAIFPLQKLADALLEEEKRGEAAAAIERCARIEKDFFSGKNGQPQPPAISMTAPDQSLVQADFVTAERLFAEKVEFFASPAGNTAGIDPLRYQLHLAEAQQALGNLESARVTLTSACAAAEQRFGPKHPRVNRIRRKLESVQ